MSPPNVIVFGPTGGVGSSTALTAHLTGARVSLAMRDPSKPIPALTGPHPTAFTRVQADLTDPASVRAAVTATAAKHAFIYLTFGTADNMAGAVTALKDAGVEFVVFLSSSGIRGEARDVQPAEFISWQHARVEMVLEEVFGAGGYVAVRPGYFATNLLQYREQVAKGGVVRMPYPGAPFDFVVPEDIGRVCGNLLVKGAQGAKGVVTLYGPQLVPQGEVLKAVGKALGKELEVEGFADDEEAVKFVMGNGLPEAGARFLVRAFKDSAEGRDVPDAREREEAVANILKYGGQEATTVDKWVEAISGKFAE
ncbi:NAD(P)H azoreductase [Parachaetomium inaequale]|uniref:NAD(P)H azoreductase n=1 Tax=Parachaetomium inaequale TaxID=2588326 RepID=A0AAN6SMT4_9PEZI|nr:NAD(P)H azoreductase [Parachaetomium inaequale]